MKLYKLFIYAFLLSNLFDVISTVMVGEKHGYEYEVNPIYILTGSIWLAFIVKAVLVAIIYLMLTRWYHRFKVLGRYMIVYIIFILTAYIFVVAHNNYSFYKLEPSEIRPPMTKEEAVEFNVARFKSQETIQPVSRGMENYIFLINIMQFIIWRSFEKWNEESIII